MRQDRFLLIILLAILLLAAAAVGLFFARSSGQVYGPDDTPEGVVKNYVIALSDYDYPRAYAYLKEGQGKPDYSAFQQAFLTQRLDAGNTALQIGKVEVNGNQAWLELFILHGSRGPFGDVYTENAAATLERDPSGEWKISNMPYAYWDWSWYNQQQEFQIPSPPKPLD